MNLIKKNINIFIYTCLFCEYAISRDLQAVGTAYYNSILRIATAVVGTGILIGVIVMNLPSRRLAEEGREYVERGVIAVVLFAGVATIIGFVKTIFN